MAFGKCPQKISVLYCIVSCIWLVNIVLFTQLLLVTFNKNSYFYCHLWTFYAAIEYNTSHRCFYPCTCLANKLWQAAGFHTHQFAITLSSQICEYSILIIECNIIFCTVLSGTVLYYWYTKYQKHIGKILDYNWQDLVITALISQLEHIQRNVETTPTTYNLCFFIPLPYSMQPTIFMNTMTKFC